MEEKVRKTIGRSLRRTIIVEAKLSPFYLTGKQYCPDYWEAYWSWM